MTIPVDILKHRHAKLAAALQSAGLEAIALNPGPSLHYLTGIEFHLSERPVVCLFRAEGAPVLVLPELESAKSRNLPYELQAFTYPENPREWLNAYEKAVQAAGLRASAGKVGVEDRVLRLLEYRLLKQAAPEADWVNAENAVASLRMYKDAAEQAAMQKAVDVAQKALEATLPLVKIGMTENEVSAELMMQTLRHGSGKPPFEPIVAAGPENTANPHYFPQGRKLAAGELLLVDWGASHDGYYSDLTRTFAIGEVSAELQKIHQAVQDANAAAHAIAAPGVTCGAVDKVARDVIEAAGYGKYFTHRLGHGLGMEGHEEPYMRGDNTLPLEEGMTFTIEPGIYISGTGGVRIEDDVVVTAGGLRSFSDMPREMRVVG
ncbi:MAG: aminopeptidase P family protein [Anaerolineae bacterium]|nr:MAG: aminopeptidase P family protein [Anaerolineae bacterium]